MKVVSSSPILDQQVRKYIQKKLMAGPRASFQLVMEHSPSDVFLAVDGTTIRGVGTHLRIAPATSAVANMRLSWVPGAESIAAAIVESITDRASQAGNSFVSCIPGADRQPSETALRHLGFERHAVRAVFGGEVKSVEPGNISQSLEMNDVLELLKELAGRAYLTFHFRPAPLTLSTLNYATSHGALFLQAEPERGGVLAFVSPCIFLPGGVEHLIPYSLKRTGGPTTLGRMGEMSIMGGVGLRPAIQSALAWLRSKDISKVTIYAGQDRDLGVLLMELGLNPRGTQDVWMKTITGPIDFYLGS